MSTSQHPTGDGSDQAAAPDQAATASETANATAPIPATAAEVPTGAQTADTRTTVTTGRGERAGAEPAAAPSPAQTQASAPDQAPPPAPEPSQDDLDRLVAGTHSGPHSILGAHPVGPGRIVIRTLRPEADAVSVIIEGERHPLAVVHPGGIFGAVLDTGPTDYRIEVSYGGQKVIVDDPYRWLPTLGELDLHLLGEGRHEQLWNVLGAHVRSYDTPSGQVTGTSFAVWAPKARAVRIVGDFDYWSGRAFPMRSMGGPGIWELFVPGVGDGARYKFQILGADGEWRDKADPMAFATEVPPATASVVFTSEHVWHDEQWLAQRAETPCRCRSMRCTWARGAWA